MMLGFFRTIVQYFFPEYRQCIVTVEDHSEKLKDHDKKLNDLDYIKEKVVFIEGQINMVAPLVVKMAGGLAIEKTASPKQLTDLGNEIASEIKALELVTSNISALEELIGFNGIDNPYDLQAACFDIAQKELSEIIGKEALEKIKQTAFDRGMTLELIFRVISFVLRDHLIEKHPEWSLAEIDKSKE